MTPITATLHSPSTIRLDFRYDAATKEAVKALRGSAWDKDGKFWTVPIRSLDALVQAFGASLSIDDAVLDAKIASDMARVRVFVANLHAAGISLDVVNGRVMGSGGAYCVDPWQREIDARADGIVSLGLQCSQAPGAVEVPAPNLDYAPVTAEVMRQAEILVSGLHNAQQNQYAEKAMRKAMARRRRLKVT